MDFFARMERFVLGMAIIIAVAVLIGVGKIDATSGLGYMTGAVGLVVTGSLVGTKLGQPTAATGSQGFATVPPTSGSVTPSEAAQAVSQVPHGGAGTIGG
jgi:hypothetical protein